MENMSDFNNVMDLPQEELSNDQLSTEPSHRIDNKEQSDNLIIKNGHNESVHMGEFFDSKLSSKSSISNEREYPTYAIGELFWGRVYSYCYWPCIVCSDPQSDRIISEQISEDSGNQLVSVHVRFFADNGRRYWIKDDNLLSFTNLEDYYKLIEKTKDKYGANGSKIKDFLPTRRNKTIWQKAVENANIIASLPIEERLHKFFEISILDQNFGRVDHLSSHLLSDINIDHFEMNIQTKRKRSISQSSSLDSINKDQPNKRRKFKQHGSLTHMPLDENNTNIFMENLQNNFNGELHKLYMYINDFVMDHHYNENIENDIYEVVRNIWTLRELNRRQSQQSSPSTKSDLDLNGNMPSTSRNTAKRLSDRLKNIKMKEIVKARSPLNVDAVESKIILPSNHPTPEHRAKKIVKPIMDVINDIFALDIKYLFKGMHRDVVLCSYCFQAGKDLKKCSKCLQTWMHTECPNPKFTPQLSRKHRKKRRKSLASKKHDLDDENESPGALLLEKNYDITDNLICRECENGRKKCLVCKQNESSNANDDPLVTCSITQCGSVFHLRCCKYWPQAKVSMTKNHIDSFRCPSHVCHTCASDDPKNNFKQLNSNKITKCMQCPATYHSDSTCIPAGSQILTMASIICPRHSILKRDTKVNVNWCFICVGGGKLVCCETCPNAVHEQCLKIPLDTSDVYICEECESGRMPLYGELVWAKYNSYRWWPSIILPPPEVPQNIARLSHAPSDFVIRFLGTHNHGWISRRRVYLYVEGDAIDIQKRKSEVDAKYISGVNEAKEIYEIIKNKKLEMHSTNKVKVRPQPYVKIRSNRAVPPVKLHSTNTEINKCECTPHDDNPCGPYSRCLNRVLYHECNPNICPAGQLCQNQMFESRQSPRLETIYMQERGFGLVTREAILRGSFIIEYVGEVINDQEFRDRLSQKFNDRDENFYFLTVEKDYIIDADRKGNLARFINHSCDPNCQTQKWSVNSINRVGIFAIKDIPADAELTFNYHWDDLFGNEKKTCYCGTKTCTGFIGGKIKKV